MMRVCCRGEAKAALLEAVRMAQENNDHVCLQHALVSGVRLCLRQSMQLDLCKMQNLVRVICCLSVIL